jgi:hypothetical protein
MRRSKHNKTASASQPKNATAPLDPLRAGMPALDSITGVEEFRKGKKALRIIHTNEVDAYERAPSKAKRKKR